MISARKSAALYNVNRKTIERWRTELAGSGKEDLACREEEIALTNDESIATVEAGLNVEIKKLRQQLAHERLRSEALQTIIKVAELDLGLDIRKKRLPQQ